MNRALVRQLVLCAISTASLMATDALLAARDAHACSSAALINLRFLAQDGALTTRRPSLLFSSNQFTPVGQSEFTLTDIDANMYAFDIDVIEQDNLYTLTPRDELPAGNYTLTYTTEDTFSSEEPKPDYTRSLSFAVAPQTAHAHTLWLGLDWTKIRRRMNDPIAMDGCGFTNNERHKVDISFPTTCRSETQAVRFRIDFYENGVLRFTKTADASNARLEESAADMMNPGKNHVSSVSGDSLGNIDSITVTAYTTTGVISDPVTLEAPTRCGDGIKFDESANYRVCEGAAGKVSQIALGEPFPSTSCGFTTGFPPCEGIVCDGDQVCDEGACVDPCEVMTCSGGQECVAGECVEVDPCALADCADGELCIACADEERCQVKCVPPLEISIASPADGETIAQLTVLIEGTTAADAEVIALIDDEPVDVQRDGEAFSIKKRLGAGAHEANIQATRGDEVAMATPLSFTLVAPPLTVNGEEKSDGEVITISAGDTIGGVAAPGEVITVEIDGEEVCTTTANGSGEWTCMLGGDVEGELVIKDSEGNILGRYTVELVGGKQGDLTRDSSRGCASAPSPSPTRSPWRVGLGLLGLFSLIGARRRRREQARITSSR